MAWAGFVLAAAPSLADYHHSGRMGALQAAAWAAVLAGLLRLFYDCLLHWTGAGPAEYYSARKRPAYRAYQQTTRCFFPLELPFVSHFRTPGWPMPDEQD